MSWTRLDDLWSESQVIRRLGFEARFHYLSMVQFCSRRQQYDGFMLAVDAERVSDVPDPRQCISEIVTVGLVRVEVGGYVLTRIDEHLPPPHLRDDHARKRSRDATQAWRKRKCDAGEHTRHCPKDTCPEKRKMRGDRVGDQSPDQSRQDGTGQDSGSSVSQSEDPWADVVVPEPRDGNMPDHVMPGRPGAANWERGYDS